MRIVQATVIILTAFLFSCGSKNESASSKEKEKKPNIQLTGELTNGAQQTLYLNYLPVGGEKVVDSVVLDEKGKFEFAELEIPGPGFYTLKINNQQFCVVILEEGQKIHLTGDAQNLGYTYVATGSKDTEVYQEITDISMRHKNTVDSLGADFQAKLGPNRMNPQAFNELSEKYEGVYNQINDKFYQRLIKVANENPNSLASIAAVGQLDPNLYIEEYKKLDENLARRYKQYNQITSFSEQVKKYSVLAIGSMAPELTLQDPDGKTVTLSSLKGKVVLIDFWASWCKPCLKEAPNVVKVYKKYKNKGFEIYGVSLDQDKDAWLRAISANDLTWKHVCDFGGWYSPAAKAYDVTAIPFTVLLDKEGRIVNKGLRGEQLGEKLKELLGS